MNDLLLKALRCEDVPRPPVWLMRQAGRYMPQYRALRARHTLWEMFHHPELAAQITDLPLQLLGVDAAILFSDILVIAEALGFRLEFPEGMGPQLFPPLRTKEQVIELPLLPVKETLSFVFESIALVKQRISVPLIGFCGGPFTVASYLIDSTSRHAFQHTKEWIARDPESFHLLLDKITQVTLEYLKEQVRTGVDVIQIFDSWANILDDAEFAEYCLPYLKRLLDGISGTPVILFCRSSSIRYESLSRLKPTGISFDWHLSMAELRKKVPEAIAIQGNFEPTFLKSSPQEITAGVQSLLSSLDGARGVIVNLGHGVTPDIPLENVQAFVAAVKS